jgi:TRAP-type mannitol/chloroaromatic compound transport system substrate-binding protein
MVAIAVTGLMSGAALAETTKLRIQTHYAPETVSGKLAAQFVDDVQVMSNGEISIEMFYASSVVKSVETFDAAATGILDCDMTGGAYQTGKNPAFQFVGDIMGGYDTPYQQLSWLYHGDGFSAADNLYGKYGMKLVGWWVYGQESLASSKPIAGPADLKDWKFRSPPGLETEIFANLGAKPIVMDFTEIFTALETGIIDGADASGIANNVGLGLYDIVNHTNYPGFHSMPSDHLACNKAKWDGMPEHHRRIMDTGADLRGEERRGRGRPAGQGREYLQLVEGRPGLVPRRGAAGLGRLGGEDAGSRRAGQEPPRLPQTAWSERQIPRGSLRGPADSFTTA